MLKLAVKLEKIEKRRKNTPILHYAAGFILLAKTLDYIHKFRFENIVTAIPFFLVALLSIIYGNRIKKWDPQGKYNQWFRLVQTGFFVILGILFLNIEGVIDEIIVFVYGAICAYLFVVEKKTFEECFVELDKEGIVLPGDVNNTVLQWFKVKDLVARPDFITIFKENNQYLQLELMHNEPAEKLETINTYARQRIQQFK